MNDPKDHDLLVGLSAQFRSFADEMRDKVNAFVDGHKDHETRIRLLESQSERTDATFRTLKWSLGSLSTIAIIVEPFIIWYLSSR